MSIIRSVNNVAQRLVHGAPPKDAPPDLAAIPLNTLHGDPLDAEVIRGKVVLFVNVASKCGFTPQYEDLVKLQQTYASRGFTVVGAPCNQFGRQEPGSPDQIEEFCSLTYGVDFPLLSKLDVNGSGRAPLYSYLVLSPAGGGDDVAWNFEKFLVDRSGNVVGRWGSQVKPTDTKITAAIEAAL